MNLYWTHNELEIIKYWNESSRNKERRKINVELWLKIKKQKQK